ncbi:MAG TPA: glycosyltransferase 87 family protein [Candidatus Limnocylindria bacterium]
MGRRAAGLIALAIAVVLAGPVLAYVAGSWEYHDLWCFYHGGTAVVRGVDPYDGPTWAALTADPARVQGDRVVKTPCPGAFAYPYWSALAFVPLALLPYDAAAGVWGALLIAGVLAGVALVIRATGAPALLVAALAAGSLSLIQVLTFGQLTGVLFPLLGLSVIARPARAGIATALLALKPQLAGLYGLALLRGASARFVLSAAAALVVLAAASIAAFPAWPGEWLRELTTNRVEIARPLPTAAGLASLLFGDARFAVVFIVALLGAIGLLARGRRIDRVTRGGIAMAVSLFAVPYAYTYDHLFLLLPWAVVSAAAARAAPPDRRVLLVALVGAAVLLPWAIFAVSFATGSDTYNALIPALAAILVTVSSPRGETMAS